MRNIELGAVREFRPEDYGEDDFPRAKGVDISHILTVAEIVGLIDDRREWYGRISHVGGGRWTDRDGRFIARTNQNCQIWASGRHFVPVEKHREELVYVVDNFFDELGEGCILTGLEAWLEGRKITPNTGAEIAEAIGRPDAEPEAKEWLRRQWKYLR